MPVLDSVFIMKAFNNELQHKTKGAQRGLATSRCSLIRQDINKCIVRWPARLKL